MSLEAVIEKNTATVERLINLLITGIGTAAAAQPGKAASVPVPALATPVPAATPAAATPAPAAADATQVLDFASLEQRFRALVTKDRPAAEKLLADLKIAKLRLATLPQYPAIDEALKKAGL